MPTGLERSSVEVQQSLLDYQKVPAFYTHVRKSVEFDGAFCAACIILGSGVAERAILGAVV